MDHDTFGFIVATAVVIIPALAFTARFALMPLLQSRRDRAAPLPDGLEQRVRALESEVRELREENATVRDEVQKLQSAEAFYRELQLPAQSPPQR